MADIVEELQQLYCPKATTDGRTHLERVCYLETFLQKA